MYVLRIIYSLIGYDFTYYKNMTLYAFIKIIIILISINYSYILCYSNQHNLMGIYDLSNCIRIIDSVYLHAYITNDQWILLQVVLFQDSDEVVMPIILQL